MILTPDITLGTLIWYNFNLLIISTYWRRIDLIVQSYNHLIVPTMWYVMHIMYFSSCYISRYNNWHEILPYDDTHLIRYKIQDATEHIRCQISLVDTLEYDFLSYTSLINCIENH